MPPLTLAQANKIVDVALAKARELKIKPLAVAVLDHAVASGDEVLRYSQDDSLSRRPTPRARS